MQAAAEDHALKAQACNLHACPPAQHTPCSCLLALTPFKLLDFCHTNSPVPPPRSPPTFQGRPPACGQQTLGPATCAAAPRAPPPAALRRAAHAAHAARAAPDPKPAARRVGGWASGRQGEGTAFAAVPPGWGCGWRGGSLGAAPLPSHCRSALPPPGRGCWMLPACAQ